MSDKIILKGMIFYGFHGVNQEEKSLGQRFIVDVEMDTSLQEAGKTDDLSKTVHYGHVYKLIRDIVTGQSYNLIEAVAERIAAEILDKYTTVKKATIRIKKTEVPIEGVLDFAGVEIDRSRKSE